MTKKIKCNYFKLTPPPINKVPTLHFLKTSFSCSGVNFYIIKLCIFMSIYQKIHLIIIL